VKLGGRLLRGRGRVASPAEPTRVFFDQQVGQHLRGFAEPHVVGEDAGELVLAQVLQPREAVQLVGAQREAEA